MSGTGSYACQLAKNVFHAGKVITTVSTSKVPRVPELLGQGVVDEGQFYPPVFFIALFNLIDIVLVIDYTKNDPTQVIPRGSVDFILDTTGDAMRFLSLMKPSTSFIASVATMPSGNLLQESSLMRRPDKPRLPWLARIGLNMADAVRRFRAWRWGVEYEYFILEPSAEELETLSTYVEERKVVPVVGSRVRMHDIDKVREACSLVYNGKGGIGKAIIEVI